MTNPNKSLIVDIDGTLADVHHRLNDIEGMTPNWDEFFSKLSYDPVNKWCAALCRLYYTCGRKIHLVTGRPNRYREPTEKWLIKYEVPYTSLFMRDDGDFRSDDIVKREIFLNNLKDEDIEFVVDDRKPVVKMWRDLGLTCLQCNPS